VVRNAATLTRIRALVIPPAWTDVWICPLDHGHIQATGRDARGRKQYIYHADWRALRDQDKFDRLLTFARSLPALRRRVRRDLNLRGLPKEKVMAAVIHLLETTLVRVGNKEYAKANHTFGLTTLRNGHAQVNGTTVHFEFVGKSGIKHRIDVHDRRLANIVKGCQELPGQVLFEYVDGAGVHSLTSGDVNRYLSTVTGTDFTAKDFRTWAGTVLAAVALGGAEPANSAAQAKRSIAAAIDAVARQLRNTRTVCRQCYVHPAVFDGYLDGTLQAAMTSPIRRASPFLSAEESRVCAFLQARTARRARAGRQE
jgi:DNA topoisomerase-1